MSAVDSGAYLFDTAVNTIQSGLTVSGNNITGTLYNLTMGVIPEYWGEGHFMALDFSNIPDGSNVRVGLEPSQGSGFVELDEDHNGVFKVTDKNTQVFKVITSKAGQTKTDTYTLDGLTLE